MKFLDILRGTETDLETLKERKHDDYWTEPTSHEFSAPWTGRTRFTILRPEPPAGKKWVEGRLTRIQKTTRPDNVWTEFWGSLSPNGKKEAIEKWAKEKPKRDEARAKRGITRVEPEDEEAFNTMMAEVKAKYAIKDVPAMPTI